MVFSAPLQAALLTVVYFDLRVRKEGFDLELLAHELGASRAAPAAANCGPVRAGAEPRGRRRRAAVARAGARGGRRRRGRPSAPRAAPPPPGWGQRPGDAG